MTSKKARVSNQASGDITQLPHDMFFAAVETTRMPMIVTDPNRDDNPIIFANRAFLEMTGYGLEEIIGRNCRFLQGPETDASIVDTLRDSIAQRVDIATEILNYRKDGSSILECPVHIPHFQRARRPCLLLCLAIGRQPSA